MTDWKIGHYEVGLRDGGSSWHTGTTIHRECTYPECIALFREEAEIARLRKIEEAARAVVLAAKKHTPEIAALNGALAPSPGVGLRYPRRRR